MIHPQLAQLARDIGEQGLAKLRTPDTPIIQQLAQKRLLENKLAHGYREAVVATLYLAQYCTSFSDELVRQVQLGFLLHDLGMSLAGTYWWSNTHDKPIKVRGHDFDHITKGLDMIYAYEDAHPWWASQSVTRDVVLSHHERLDGSGCKRVEAGKLSFIARFSAVVDQLVSRCESRPYNATYPRQTLREAVDALKSEPHRFDAGIVERFEQLFDQYFTDVHREQFEKNGLADLRWIAEGWMVSTKNPST